jgi:gamma-tubulin complex component 4
MIREQDLQLALLRASLGTSAQHDPSLGNLRCTLPSGPLHPLLPSFTQTGLSRSRASVQSLALEEQATFDDLLLGTPMRMTYAVQWPLDLFLQPADLRAYGALFAYVAALRRTHVRVHACWAALSNAQRARRRWTGLGEGGTAEDARTRHALLRCGWGVVRQMGFFLDALLEYVMVDVVDAEFRRLKARLARPQPAESAASRRASVSSALPPRAEPKPAYLDFTTLRAIHATYLDRLLIGSLLANPTLTALIRPILETCEQLVAQVERWGGDVLPALLFEGSAQDAERDVGSLVRERWGVVSEINQVYILSLPIMCPAHVQSAVLPVPFGVLLRATGGFDVAATPTWHHRRVAVAGERDSGIPNYVRARQRRPSRRRKEW